MKNIVLIVSLALCIGCAAGNKGAGNAKLDLSKFDVNNTLSTLERAHAKATVYITTTPPGAEVFMDGKYVGKANHDVVYLIPGHRVITLIKEKKYFQKKIYFKEGGNEPLDITLQ